MNIDAVLHTRRRWALLLLRKRPYKVILTSPSGIEASAESDTPAGAYDAACEMGRLFGDFDVTTPCPWDDDGNIIGTPEVVE